LWFTTYAEEGWDYVVFSGYRINERKKVGIRDGGSGLPTRESVRRDSYEVSHFYL